MRGPSPTAALLNAMAKGIEVDQLAWRLGLNPNDREDARELSLQSGFTIEEAMRAVHHQKLTREATE